jgi:hypothetical protein
VPTKGLRASSEPDIGKLRRCDPCVKLWAAGPSETAATPAREPIRYACADHTPAIKTHYPRGVRLSRRRGCMRGNGPLTSRGASASDGHKAVEITTLSRLFGPPEQQAYSVLLRIGFDALEPQPRAAKSLAHESISVPASNPAGGPTYVAMIRTHSSAAAFASAERR